MGASCGGENSCITFEQFKAMMLKDMKVLLDEPEMGLERQPLRTLHFAKDEIGKGLRRRRIRQGRVHCCPARLTYRYPRPALRFSLPFSTHAMLAAPSGGGTQEMF